MFAVTADVHAHPFGDFATIDSEGVNSRLQRTVDALAWAMSTASDQGATTFVIAGDLFHSRKDVPTIALDMVSEVLEEAQDTLDIILLLGNHDLNTSTHHASIAALSGIGQVVMDVTEITTRDDERLGLIPWCDTQDQFEAMWNELPLDLDAYIGHFGTFGANFGPYNIEIPGDINPQPLVEDRLMLLGHYHRRQNVFGNTWYVGSPLQHTWAEAGDWKGFAVVDGGHLSWVENRSSPRFVKVDMREDAPPQPRSFDYVKVIAADERDAADQVKTLNDLANGEARVKVEVVRERDDPTRLALAGLEQQQMVERYVDHKGCPDGLAPDKIVNAGCLLLSGEME